MHLYFGAFFALAALLAITTLIAFAQPEPQAVRRAQLGLGIAWLCIFLTTLISPAPPTIHYKGAILFVTLAIGFALAFYHFIPSPRAVAGWLLMMAGGVLFFTFTARTTFGLPSPLVIVVPLLAIWAYFRFVPSPRVELRPDIIAFLAVWGLAGWQAVELWWQHGTIWSLLGMLGMLVLLLGPLAHDMTRRNPLALRFYAYAAAAALLANWFMALSVWTIFDSWI